MLVAVLVRDRETGRLSYETRMALVDRQVLRPGVRLYEGVPYRQTPGNDNHDQQYVVVAHPFATELSNQKSADMLLKNLQTELSVLPVDEFLDQLSSRITRTPRSDETRDLWSLMLIRLARTPAAHEYLAGRNDLGHAFLSNLRPTGERLPEYGPEGLHIKALLVRIFNPLHGIAHFVADQQLIALLELQHEERLQQLARVKELGETYIQSMLFVAGLLTGVSEILVIDLALQAFIGYIQFLSDLEDVEQDGEITSDEKFGMSISFVCIFLPFAPFIKGLRHVEKALGIAAMGMLAWATIRGIAGAVADLYYGSLRLLAADEAGFNTYTELDISNTVFIPRPTTGTPPS